MNDETRTAEITIFGQTRTIEIRPINDGARALTDYVFASQIGAGVKRYPANMLLVAAKEGAPVRRDTVTDSTGKAWRMSLSAVTRNRQARIVGWDDTVTNEWDQTRRA